MGMTSKDISPAALIVLLLLGAVALLCVGGCFWLVGARGVPLDAINGSVFANLGLATVGALAGVLATTRGRLDGAQVSAPGSDVTVNVPPAGPDMAALEQQISARLQHPSRPYLVHDGEGGEVEPRHA